MCIVIDINTFAFVFNPESSNHAEFRPVREWIISGRGKIVYGGSKYEAELKKAVNFFGLFIELKKKGKVVEVNKQEVDEKQLEVEKIANTPQFDDPHIVAIIIISGCKLICSVDERAYPFFKHRDLYPENISIPKIYSGLGSQELLLDKNIADVCKPTVKLRKEDGKRLLSQWDE